MFVVADIRRCGENEMKILKLLFGKKYEMYNKITNLEIQKRYFNV